MATEIWRVLSGNAGDLCLHDVQGGVIYADRESGPVPCAGCARGQGLLDLVSDPADWEGVVAPTDITADELERLALLATATRYDDGSMRIDIEARAARDSYVARYLGLSAE